MIIQQLFGNEEILKLHKTGFLCSRKVPASALLKCYDWAIAQRDAGNCVISGFHSTIEKDVLYYLIKGSQPVILALARGLKKKIESEFTKPIEQGRLLFITPFDNTVSKITQENAIIRNQMIVDLADEVVIGYTSPSGLLEKNLQIGSKPIKYLIK